MFKELKNKKYIFLIIKYDANEYIYNLVYKNFIVSLYKYSCY